MRNVLLTVLGVIDLLANVPYIIDTYRGKTKPNIATWSTFTLLNAITVVAGLAAHNALNTAILGFSYLVGSVSILALAFIKGTRKYSRFDAVCQALAILGIIFWLATRTPGVALAAVIAVGEIAALPMYRHAFLYPDEETWSTFMIASLVALGVLCLATTITFASLAVPLDLAIGNGAMAAIILARRSHLNRKLARKAQPIV